MIPPKTIKFHVLKRILRRYGIVLRPGGKHMRFERSDGAKYPVPFREGGEDVERAYVDAMRRGFGLTEEDGVPDEEFYEG